MIDIDKLNLPLCALGAGAAHVAVLGLVLSLKLPGPSESMTPTQVAISG